MARRLELSWDKNRKRWKKVYRGKQYYFPFGESKADMAARSLANQAAFFQGTQRPWRSRYRFSLRLFFLIFTRMMPSTVSRRRPGRGRGGRNAPSRTRRA